MRKQYFLDLFAGAGGLSEGFIQAGFRPLAHIEKDKAACNTLKTRMAYHWLKDNDKLEIYQDYIYDNIPRNKFYKNIPQKIINSVINKEINKRNIKEIFKKIDAVRDSNKPDIIIGGPPCQAYSIAGRSRDKNNMIGDKRNYLYNYYADFLKKYEPKLFIFENVLGLLSAKDKNGNKYLKSMINKFQNILTGDNSYKVEFRVLNSHNLGIPQSRKRILIIGRKGGGTNFYPDLDEKECSVKINELFKDLPKLNAGEGKILPINRIKTNIILDSLGISSNKIPITFHSSRPNNNRDLQIYEIAVKKWYENKERLKYDDLPEYLKTHNNRKSFVDRYKVVAGNRTFSHTIVSHISKDGHYYIHPDISQNRSLTPREAARIQTFPDSYYFESQISKPGRTHAYKQIGNAVPVLMAKKIAEKVKPLL